jgi:hypothetical protein
MKTVLFEDKNKYDMFAASSTQTATPASSSSTKTPPASSSTTPASSSTTPASPAPLAIPTTQATSTTNINVNHLVVNALMISIITYLVTVLFVCPKTSKDYLLIAILALIAGLLYSGIEIIFIKYINNGDINMSGGNNNAYAYYSSENKVSPYTKKGGSFPYRYFDGQYPASQSF